MSQASSLLLKECEARRSYRKFLPTPIDKDTLMDCILTASTAPSGANKQPWHFSVVVSSEMKQKIRNHAEVIEKEFYESRITKEWAEDLSHLAVTHEKPFLTEAPCLIVIFKENYRELEDGSIEKNYYPTESTGIAIGLLINALRNAGYASLTYTPAPITFLRDVLNRPKGETPLMILAVGKADPNYELPTLTKKTFDEIAEFL